MSALALEIQVKDSAVVDGEYITLGAVADIMPKSKLADFFAAIEIKKAPEPGKQESLKLKDIKRILTNKDDSITEARWVGPRYVRITRGSLVITPDKIQSILEKFLAENINRLPSADISFKKIHLPKPFHLSKGALDVEVIPSDPLIIKSNKFTLIFRVNGKVEKNIALRGKLRAFAPVVVAAKGLRRGNIIQRGDISLAPMDITELRNPTFDPSEVVGKKMKRTTRRGQPLDFKTIEFPPMIRRGEAVMIIAHKGSLTVTARGYAKNDGKKDAVIKILNNNSQKEVLGRVSAPGLVTVEL